MGAAETAGGMATEQAICLALSPQVTPRWRSLAFRALFLARSVQRACAAASEGVIFKSPPSGSCARGALGESARGAVRRGEGRGAAEGGTKEEEEEEEEEEEGA